MILVLGITAAAMAEAMKLQKMKLMAMNTLQGNGGQNGMESEHDDLNSNMGEYLQESKSGDSVIYSALGQKEPDWGRENNTYTLIVSNYYRICLTLLLTCTLLLENHYKSESHLRKR